MGHSEINSYENVAIRIVGGHNGSWRFFFQELRHYDTRERLCNIRVSIEGLDADENEPQKRCHPSLYNDEFMQFAVAFDNDVVIYDAETGKQSNHFQEILGRVPSRPCA